MYLVNGKKKLKDSSSTDGIECKQKSQTKSWQRNREKISRQREERQKTRPEVDKLEMGNIFSWTDFMERMEEAEIQQLSKPHSNLRTEQINETKR